MKQLKFLSLVLGCMTVLSLSSCLKDDDSNNNGLSASDVNQCLNIVRGDYTGHMLYLTDLNRQTADTVDVNWSITSNDTTLTVNNFPTAAFTHYLSNKDLRDAVAEQWPRCQLKCKLAFTMLDPYVQFLVGPQKMVIPVRYQDAEHKLSVLYWYNDYSFGVKDTSTNVMTVRMVIGGAFLDNDDNTNLLPDNYSNPTGTYTPWLPIIITTSLTLSSSTSV